MLTRGRNQRDASLIVIDVEQGFPFLQRGRLARCQNYPRSMIYTQPIIYELGDLRVPVLLVSGDKDNTTLGKGFAPPEVLPKLGHYAQLAKEAVRKIPGAQLVEYADLGHGSWIQDPTRFNKTLLDALGRHGQVSSEPQ